MKLVLSTLTVCFFLAAAISLIFGKPETMFTLTFAFTLFGAVSLLGIKYVG